MNREHAPLHEKTYLLQNPQERPTKDLNQILERLRRLKKEETGMSATSFLRLSEPGVIERIVDAMHAKTRFQVYKQSIEGRYPRLRVQMEHADTQQDFVEYMLSSKPLWVEYMKRQGTDFLRKEGFGVKGALGLAAVFDLVGRTGYEYAYPDPLMDVLLKIDAEAYEEKTDSLFLIQAKALPELDAITTLAAREFTHPKHRMKEILRPENYEDIRNTLTILSRSARVLGERFQEQMVPVFIGTPDPESRGYEHSFDKETGLPLKALPGIILPSVVPSSVPIHAVQKERR